VKLYCKTYISSLCRELTYVNINGVHHVTTNTIHLSLYYLLLFPKLVLNDVSYDNRYLHVNTLKDDNLRTNNRNKLDARDIWHSKPSSPVESE
jgi:hypothetical protein